MLLHLYVRKILLTLYYGSGIIIKIHLYVINIVNTNLKIEIKRFIENLGLRLFCYHFVSHIPVKVVLRLSSHNLRAHQDY